MDVDYRLNGIGFQWDSKKAAANSRKHHLNFKTACEIFFDPFICYLGSEDIDGEEREMVIGMTVDWQMLVVVFVDRKDSIRLISARPTTRKERQIYEDQ